MNGSEEPLVYTIKGNLPIAGLEYFHEWEDTPEYVKFVEGYRLDGEIVKQASHVLMKHGNIMGVEQENF